MAKYDANWWFGKNSVWQKSGLGSGVEEGTKGFFSNITGFFGGKSKPEVVVKHGADTTSWIIGGLVLLMLMRK